MVITDRHTHRQVPQQCGACALRVNKYVYYENKSKNRNGTSKQLRVKNKVVPLHPCLEASE